MRLIIRRGARSDVEDGADDIRATLSDTFDLVNDRDMVRALAQRGYDNVTLDFEANARERFTQQVLVMVSLVRINGGISCESLRDANDIVDELRIDFHQREPAITALDEVEQNGVKAAIHRHYLDAVSRNDCLLPRRANAQAVVKERFDGIGLADDIMMRSPRLSGNDFWTCSITDRSALVRTRDIRLEFAKFLSEMPCAKSFLEVGAGSGFCSLYLSAWGKQCRGSELTARRVEGARLLSAMAGVPCQFEQGDLARLPYEENSYDVVFSCFVLEQCAEILDQAIREAARVARRNCVFLEPTTEFNTTLPGLIHNEMFGQPLRLYDAFVHAGYTPRVVRPRISHYHNPGAIYVLDVSR